MNDIDEPMGSVLRTALHEAAAQVEVGSTPVELSKESTARPRRRLPLVAAGMVAVLAALLVVGTSLLDDGSSRAKISVGSQTPPSGPRGEVAPALLPSGSADIEFFMKVGAPDADVAAVHSLLLSSTDVYRFAYMSREDAYREFAKIFSANPELVQSIRPQDLPVSFRVVTIDAEATSRLRALLAAQPGVETFVERSQRSAACDCLTDTTDATPAPAADPLPNTTLPALPAPIGPGPVDEQAARDAVIAAYTQAFTGTNPIDVRRAAMQDSAALAPLLDQARVGHEAQIDSLTVVVSGVSFLDATHAALTYQFTVQGIAQPVALGGAVLDGGSWKVSRETTCAALQQAGFPCPA